ncbi:hypothetical protein MAM1_0396c10289 [Mucor ambiguus]|uniref:Uncharacterized protein n=1 Tax=Mucor ambiguus TaxID=91626 RepID=A0A0C9N3U9_9FUNG|nr:hypothetical protein MAM1_0396c10289 [Mucor ambiguus]
MYTALRNSIHVETPEMEVVRSLEFSSSNNKLPKDGPKDRGAPETYPDVLENNAIVSNAMSLLNDLICHQVLRADLLIFEKKKLNFDSFRSVLGTFRCLQLSTIIQYVFNNESAEIKNLKFSNSPSS